jgi:M6 family metalloprotease-like protein
MSRRLAVWPNIIVLVALFLASLAGRAGRDVLAEEPTDSRTLEERVLEEAARNLGWPTEVGRTALVRSGGDSEVLFMLWPPESAVRFFARPVYSATNGGSYEEETIQYLRVLNLGEAGCREFIDKLVENGFAHSSYQGREGVVVRHGDQICDPGGLLGFLMEFIRKLLEEFLKSLMEEGWEMSDDDCAEADAGMIVWTCGSYAFVARDDTGQGAEDDMAAALYVAAQRQSLCDLGDTLVILAGADDQLGGQPLAVYQKMGQDVNSYYGQNAYGRVALSYSYMDADGDAGAADWYSLGPTIGAWANHERDFAMAAVKKAFEGGAPRDELNLARVIVVYAGPSKQANAANGVFSTLCCWPNNGQWFDIEVGPEGSKAHVFAGSLIMVAEQDGLGLWTHEVGHSLFSHNVLWNKYYRVSDRYNYAEPWGQYGNINNWGLMGAGNWWGDPTASVPVHMDGFTKESAEWLTYLDAELGRDYTLTALERQRSGGTVLRIDDPQSADPRRFLILEARDSTAAYGAPESGVVLYLVSWAGGHDHHVVNAITPDKGGTTGVGPAARVYWRPTFRGAGDPAAPTMRRWPAAKLEWTLKSESTANGYSAVVCTNVYTPANLVGAVVGPAGAPAVPPPAGGAGSSGPNNGVVATGPYLPLPDIDLHAYDDQGRHVGLDYRTGEYEAQIPGAEFSGDLKDAEEWIYVPEGTKVRFEVSAFKTEQFLQANRQYSETIRPKTYETTYQRIDEQGVLTAAKGGKERIAAGEQAELEGPDAPGLKYRPVRSAGYGKNLPENLYLAGLLIAIVAMGLIGWVVALARR